MACTMVSLLLFSACENTETGAVVMTRQKAHSNGSATLPPPHLYHSDGFLQHLQLVALVLSLHAQQGSQGIKHRVDLKE